MICLIILLINVFAINSSSANSCPPGQIASISDPSICYSFEKTKTNWFAAMQNCIDKNGNLVSVHSAFENMFISGQAGTIFTDSIDIDFWIGSIYDSLSPGKWSWTDNTSFDFNDWDKGQPQNTTGSVCASVIMNGAKWRASDCFIQKSFVCEIKQISATPAAPPAPTTTQKPEPCPETWIYLNSTNFCYKTFQNDKTWYDAEMECVDQGAHLVSLHSYEENLFVAYISNKNVNACDWWKQTWIGLTNNGGTDFKWTDGTPFDYSSWIYGAPFGSPSNSCVMSWIGQRCWDTYSDIAATEWYNYSCERKVLNSVCKKVRK